jgi:hypothetical protein
MATIDEVLRLLNSIPPGDKGTITGEVFAGIRTYNPAFPSHSKPKARNSLAARLRQLQAAAAAPQPAAPEPELEFDFVAAERQLAAQLAAVEEELQKRRDEVAELEKARAERRAQMQVLLQDLPRVASIINYDKHAMMRARQELERQMAAESVAAQKHDEEVSRDINVKFHMWKSYEEFQEDNSKAQQQEYLRIITSNYHPRPDRYVFAGLDRLNDYYAHEFFKWLEPFWTNVVGNLAATEQWTLRYQLADDSWKSTPLDRANYDKITANIKNNSFMFNDVNDMRVHFTLSGDDESHALNTFKRFEIVRMPPTLGREHIATAEEFELAAGPFNDNVIGNSTSGAGSVAAIAGERDGEYMPYYYTGDNERIREYLKRLEIGVDNPYYSCFVFALLDAGIDKNTCDKINLRCYNRHITSSNVKHIVDEFELNIRVKALTVEAKGNLKYHDIIASKSKDTPCITLYRHHWINDLLDCGINAPELGWKPARLCSSKLLVELFKLNLMAPLTIKTLPQCIRDRSERNIPDLKYNPKYCIDRQHYIAERNAFTTIDDVRKDPLQSPKYGWILLNRALGNCAAVGGVVKSFISRAIHGARYFAKSGIHKDVSLLDVNSLYPAAMSRITIPYRAPQVWNAAVDLTADDVLYYVLEVVVDAVSPSKYYKLLPAVGATAYYDRIDLEELQKHCGLKYHIKQGYYWLKSQQDVKLMDYVNGLYNKKSAANPADAKMYKFILNHSFGKTITKGFDTLKSKPFDTELELQKYVKRYGRRLVQLDMDTKTARIMKTYDKSYNFAYIGTMILSMARRIVNEYFELFTSLNIPVFLHNCDSFIIPTADVAKIAHLITPALGMLKTEKQTAEAVIIRAQQYWLADNHFRFSGIPKQSIASQPNIRQWYVNRLQRFD